MGKLLFLDLDGTLVNYSKEIPPSAAEAVQGARRAGHRIFFSTGRSRPDVPQELWDLGVDGFIGGNGSYIEVDGTVVEQRSLTREDTRQIVDWLRSRGIEFFLEANGGLFGSDNFMEVGSDAYRQYMAGAGSPVTSQLKVNELLNGYVDGGDLYRDDVNKISFVLTDYQDFVDAKSEFPHLKAGTWGGRGEQALFGDLGVPGVSKAHAVAVVLDHLGASRDDAIGFGDAGPDVVMLEGCGTAVAMGNASDEVKAIADYVTTDVDDDGLYRAFEALGLL